MKWTQNILDVLDISSKYSQEIIEDRYVLYYLQSKNTVYIYLI